MNTNLTIEQRWEELRVNSVIYDRSDANYDFEDEPDLPSLQIVKPSVKVRASSLAGLFDCPARWAAIHIDGKRTPSSSRVTLGKAVHASTAVYDQSVLDGAGLTIDEAAAAAVDAIHKPDEEVEWEDEQPSEIEKIAIDLHKKYCTVIAPTQTYQAVEIACDSLHLSDLNITLTGTTDRIRLKDDQSSIVDIKTGRTAVRADGIVETKGHAYQLGVYELLAEYASGMPINGPAQIVGLNDGKTEKGQRVGTAEVSEARSVLIGDEETPGVLRTAANIIHAGDFWGNPRSMMCGDKYCPIYKNCNFRK